MDIYQSEFGIRSNQRNEMLDITGQVSSAVKESGIQDGQVMVYCPHTTAAITINENADPSVIHDILLTLEELMPEGRKGYRHMEGNSDSHCKSSLVGASEQIMIHQSRLVLGTWQGIFFCEFDGPRTRKVQVRIIKEKFQE